MADQLTGLDAIALAQLIKNKDITSAELLETVIGRIEKVNPEINAVIISMYEQARAEAGNSSEGIFGGVPFLLKDLIAECKGVLFQEGSKALKGHISKLDSEIVLRQKRAGLIIVGKTSTPEFGILPATESALYGGTANPWDVSLSPGGSSGGAGAAVSAGIVPMAHGNDAGGSIRCPASCCGLFGLKPTRGRISLSPNYGDVIGGIASEHALTRTVRDSAALLDETAGPGMGDPYWAPPHERSFLEEVDRDPVWLKIGILTTIPEGWGIKNDIHPDCREATIDAARLCESLGHVVEEVDPSRLSYPNLFKHYGVLFSCGVGHFIKYWENEMGKKIGEDDVESMTWTSFQAGLKWTGADYLTALGKIQEFSRKVAGWYHQSGCDLLLTPTLSIPPVKLGSIQNAENPMTGFKLTNALVALTYIQNMTGQPAMSVPLYWNENNIPIGVQFAARYGEEGLLFSLAGQLEKARPWKDRIPPVNCL